MEEYTLRNWLFTGQNIDGVTLLALGVVGFAYLLAPALGYIHRSRGALMASMFCITAKLAFQLLDSGLITLFSINELLATSPSMRNRGSDDSKGMLGIHSSLAFLELCLMVLGLFLFVIGLIALKRRPEPGGSPRAAEVVDQD